MVSWGGRKDVVLLEDGPGETFSAGDGPPVRVRRLRDLAGPAFDPRSMREIRMRALSEARAAIGSWGIALVAPALGTPTILLHESLPGSLGFHLEVARTAGRSSTRISTSR